MGLIEQLGLQFPRDKIVAIVGSGGKTTLLYILAEEAKKRKMRTAIITTTHISVPLETSAIRIVTSDDIDLINRLLRNEKIVVAGTPTEDGKLKFPSDKVFNYLQYNTDILMIEADTSRRLPIKFPQNGEPVLLPRTDCVILVAGLSALGHPFGHVCQHYDILQQKMGIPPDRVVTPGLLANVLVNGYGRYLPVVLLNQADSSELYKQGIEISQVLRLSGVEKVLIYSLMSHPKIK